MTPSRCSRAALAALLLASGASATTLSGSVVGSDGAPAAGVVVEVIALPATWTPLPHAAMPDERLASGVSGEDGRFTIDAEGVPDGFHGLVLRAPGRPPLLRHRERLAFGALALPQHLRIELPDTLVMTGLALDLAQAPVAGAHVIAWCDAPAGACRASATTDAAGRFVIGALPRGASATLASEQGDRSVLLATTLPRSPAHVVALHLQAGAVKSGILRSEATGLPVVGARVQSLATPCDPFACPELLPWREARVVAECVSDARGRWQLPLQAHGCLEATGPCVATVIGDGEATVLPQDPLDVRVRDLDGPIAGAHVTWSDVPSSATTARDGGVRLPANVDAFVIATTRDGARAQAWPTTGALAIELPRLSQRTGLVVREVEGVASPVGGATVVLHGDAFDVVTGTDAAGRYGATARRVHAVSATHPGWSGRVPGHDPGTPVILRRDAQSRVVAPERVARIEVRAGARLLEGALVRGVPEDARRLTAGTDATGIAALAIPGGSLQVSASRPGFEDAARVVFASERSVVELRPLIPVMGRVLDAAGAPVAGAFAFLQEHVPAGDAGAEEDWSESWSADTDSTGDFRFLGVPSGTYGFGVIAPGHSGPRMQQLVLGPEPPGPLDVRLRPGVALRGSVRDDLGAVADARVRAELSESYWHGPSGQLAVETITDGSGSFTLPGLDPEVLYSLSVTAIGHVPGSAQTAFGLPAVDILVGRAGRIEGHVIGCAPECIVSCLQHDAPAQATTRGPFVIEPLAPGTYTCTARSGELGAKAGPLQVNAGEAARLDLELAPAPRLEVLVIDVETNVPLAAARVTFGDEAATTDSAGRAEIARPWTESFELFVKHEGYHGRGAQVASDATSIAVALIREAPTRGRVVDEAGVPMPGVDVRWWSGVVTTTDGEGRFEGCPGCSGPTVRHVRDHVLWAAHHDGTRDPDGGLVLRARRVPLATLAVHVHESGSPRAGVAVSLEGDELVVQPPHGAWTPSATGHSDGGGGFVAEDLVPGDYTVVVGGGAEGELAKRPVRLREGERASIRVDVEGAWWLDGSVSLDGRPVPAASLEVSREDGASYLLSTSSRIDGSFRAGPLPRDVGRVLVTAEIDGSDHRGSTVAARGDTAHVVLAQAATLVGRILASGQPAPQVRVEVDSEWVRSDADGRFRLGTFTPGVPVTVEAIEVGLSLTITPEPGDNVLPDWELAGERKEFTFLCGGGPCSHRGDDGWHQEVLDVRFWDAAGRQVGLVKISDRPEGGFPPMNVPLAATIALATSDDWAGSFSLAGDGPLTVMLEPTAALELGVTSERGPERHASVRVMAWEGMPLSSVTWEASLEDGIARLDALPAGRLLLEVEVGSLQRTVRHAIPLSPGETATATIRVGD